MLVDLTPPTITLSVPTITNDSRPTGSVTVTDSGSGVPDGTSAFLDVDLNNDGDFTDLGETGYATLTLVGGTATFQPASPLPDGTYGLRVRASDLAGNEGTSAVSTMLVDLTPLTVTMNLAYGQPNPTNQSPIHFTVVFSEPVTDFATGDVSFSSTAPGTLIGTVTGSGTTYDVALSGMTGNGTITATIDAGKAHDAAGNPNETSTGNANTVQYMTSTGPIIGGVVVVEATGPRDGTLTTSEGLVITFNAVDPDGVASATLQVDGNELHARRWSLRSADRVEFRGLDGQFSAGPHDYSIMATDKPGNPTSPAFTGTFDVIAATNSGPTIGSVVVVEATGPRDGTLTTSEGLVITFNAVDPDGVAGQRFR